MKRKSKEIFVVAILILMSKFGITAKYLRMQETGLIKFLS